MTLLRDCPLEAGIESEKQKAKMLYGYLDDQQNRNIAKQGRRLSRYSINASNLNLRKFSR
jgi:hypothetical protein